MWRILKLGHTELEGGCFRTRASGHPGYSESGEMTSRLPPFSPMGETFAIARTPIFQELSRLATPPRSQPIQVAWCVGGLGCQIKLFASRWNTMIVPPPPFFSGPTHFECPFRITAGDRSERGGRLGRHG